jgi:cyclopropane-fatty-acyl-phospholipid synthase
MSENVLATLDEARADHAPGAGIGRALDAALLRVLRGRLDRRLAGAVRITLPSGRSALIGRGAKADASLGIATYRGLGRLLARGLVGFADGYADGDIDVQSVGGLLEFYLANEAALAGALPALARTSRRDRRYHAGRANTRAGSRRNIADHYDLGNAFYALWLDAGMSYSSGIYRDAADTLERAQAEKHSRILEALDIAPGSRVLEIGCGWGSMIEAAARAGAEVTAITISERQHEATQRRIAAAGLSGHADVRMLDYRDTGGRFDRVVSIEMIEAVGAEDWGRYFQVLADRLEDGGHGILQAITIREDLFDGYRANPDFIQRYIFPGGMLPTVAAMRANAGAAGLAFSEVERFGLSYARTLADWRERFHESWPRIAALGFDARFRRLWDYYLTYCEVGFRHGLIDVGLYRVDKPAAVPATPAQERAPNPLQQR